MRIAGGLTVLGLVVLIGGLFAWEKRKKRLGSPADAAGTDAAHTTDDSGTHGHPSAGHASPTPA
jgi:hypothetical protein